MAEKKPFNPKEVVWTLEPPVFAAPIQIPDVNILKLEHFVLRLRQ